MRGRPRVDLSQLHAEGIRDGHWCGQSAASGGRGCMRLGREFCVSLSLVGDDKTLRKPTNKGASGYSRHGVLPRSALRSLVGVKRTCPFALHMSAYDPKRTSGSVPQNMLDLGPTPTCNLCGSKSRSKGLSREHCNETFVRQCHVDCFVIGTHRCDWKGVRPIEPF